MQSKRLLNILNQYQAQIDSVLSNEILFHYGKTKYSIYYGVSDNTYTLYVGHQYPISDRLPYKEFKKELEMFLINF